MVVGLDASPIADGGERDDCGSQLSAQHPRQGDGSSLPRADRDRGRSHCWPSAPASASVHLLLHARASRERAPSGRAKGAIASRRCAGILEGVSLGYWSGNKVVTNYFHGRLSGEMVSPKAEGTNTLMHYKSCAFIFSSKALESDKPSHRQCSG